jgi:type I restriction enzyme R subunit
MREKVGFMADLAYKTRRLVEENALQAGLGLVAKSVTFDVKTLEGLRGEKGSDEGKVFNLVRGLQAEIDDEPDLAPILVSLKDRAERILKDLESRTITGLAAIDILAGLAAEKEAALRSAQETGLSMRAFGVFWRLRDDPDLKAAGIVVLELARQVEDLLARYPNAARNPDEQRRLRAGLYRPLLGLPNDARARIVDLIAAIVL